MNNSEQGTNAGHPHQCPKAVLISATIWIVAGGLLIAGPASWVAYKVFEAVTIPIPGWIADAWILVLALLIPGYPASLIIRVALRYIRGRARDTLWLGICSLVFGLALGAFWVKPFLDACWSLITGSHGPLPPYLRVLITGSGMVVAAALLASAVLSLAARGAYRDWRTSLAEMPTKRRD